MRAATIICTVLVIGCMCSTALAADFGPGQWTESGVVFDPANRAYYPSVLYDGGQYKMWYDQGGSLGYATSSDGLSWTDGTAGLVTGAWNDTLAHPRVRQTSAGYELWFWAGLGYSINDIGHATSTDGLNWTNFSYLTQESGYEIVLNTSGSWKRGSYGPSDILFNAAGSETAVSLTGSPFDNRYAMYYDATTGGDEALGLGVSADGVHWYRWGADAPVFSGTYVSGDWDYNYACIGTVMPLDGEYHMWYSGGDGKSNHGIGYATSPDGLNWTRSDTWVYHKTDADAAANSRDDRSYTPSVVIGADGNLDMFFTGKDLATGDYHINHAGALYGAPPAGDDSPEPATWVLLACTGIAGAIRSRRRNK